MHSQSNLPGRGAQRGAILIFCLVFLLVLTTMGVASMESTVLEERMAGNMQDHNAAFQAAESSLQSAESWLIAQTLWPATSTDGSTTVWDLDAMDPDGGDALHWWEDAAREASDWWGSNAEVVDGVDGLALAPRYIVEELADINAGQSLAIGTGVQNRVRVFHRITARGVGTSDSAVVRLQSTYVKAYE
ncbi:MAG: PilX N-terminal domain-containing pilus assembly protein [Gammaproteobacteria bacterium]|nr:PilX N-terminal domain-containing pilus assembly protein [Gammaproteobacteria bacterium]